MQLPRKMSAQNVMASISRTLGTRNDASAKNSNEVKLAGEESKDKLYEPKHRQKVVRVLTVVAYVVSVSLAAIILSLYYTFIWDPRDHALYSTRQTSLNSTAKVECLNLTIPVITDLTRTNGSHVTRFPTKTSETETDSLQKLGRNLHPNDQIPIENVIDPTRDVDHESNSPASTISDLSQSGAEFLEKDEETKEQLMRDGDFSFI